jgi:hypothetical protein
MTAAHPAIPEKSKRSRKPKLDIPTIKLLSWLGLESIIWGIVIGHLIKWAGNTAYFASFQVRYAAGYGNSLYTVFYLKDFWDRLPVHVQNLLGQHWFHGQNAPQWWVTDRHDIRDVGIALIATIIVQLLFTKPKYAAGDHVSVRRYLLTIPLALGAALIPIAIIGVLAWKVPWFQQHGANVPASFGALASEVNGWVAKGTWITVVMGIAGGIAAKRFVKRPADDIQWFFAERSAGKIRSDEGLNKLRTRVIGTPAHRARVHWLLANQPELPPRNPWIVRGLIAAAFVTLVFSGIGAWLTLAGPAAVH